jgi:hypothetical protein
VSSMYWSNEVADAIAGGTLQQYADHCTTELMNVVNKVRAVRYTWHWADRAALVVVLAAWTLNLGFQRGSYPMKSTQAKTNSHFVTMWESTPDEAYLDRPCTDSDTGLTSYCILFGIRYRTRKRGEQIVKGVACTCPVHLHACSTMLHPTHSSSQASSHAFRLEAPRPGRSDALTHSLVWPSP